MPKRTVYFIIRHSAVPWPANCPWPDNYQGRQGRLRPVPAEPALEIFNRGLAPEILNRGAGIGYSIFVHARLDPHSSVLRLLSSVTLSGLSSHAVPRCEFTPKNGGLLTARSFLPNACRMAGIGRFFPTADSGYLTSDLLLFRRSYSKNFN